MGAYRHLIIPASLCFMLKKWNEPVPARSTEKGCCQWDEQGWEGEPIVLLLPPWPPQSNGTGLKTSWAD